MNYRLNFLLITGLFLMTISCESNQKSTELRDSDIRTDTVNTNLGELLEVEDIGISQEPGKKVIDELKDAIKELESRETESRPVEIDDIAQYFQPELTDSIWFCIENSSFEKLYSYVSENKTKRGLPKSEFVKYMNELKKVYGELNNHAIEKYFVRDLMNSNEIMVTGIYNVNFDKVNGKIILNFKVIDSQSIELYDINVQPDDYSTINKFDLLCRQTFQYLKTKEYKKLYDSSSETFKHYAPIDKYDQYMSRFDSIDFNEYKLFQNRISTTLNRLRYDLIYDIDNGTGLLTLIFTESNKNFILDGIIYESK